MQKKYNAEIGIIGGTGIYDFELKNKKKITVKTPYGKTSDSITIGEFENKKIAFLPRHGNKHSIPPHLVNFKANIWAYKKIGIKRIISISSVGSLREKIKPGQFALPSQFLDFTRFRDGSFSKIGNVIHISVAEPFCPELQLIMLKISKNFKIKLHKNCIYTCIEGPRFSTIAESNFFRNIGSDIVGMTLVPECQLAREVQICYISISIVTDYDSWFKENVTAKNVSSRLKQSSKTISRIIAKLIEQIPGTKNCSCEKDLLTAKL